METPSLWLFITAAGLLILTPGPNFIYVLTRGATQGRRAALVSVLGLGCGVMLHTAFAAVGLSVLLRASATLFLVVKVLGGGYLVYLGLRAIRAGDVSLAAVGATPASTVLVRQSITASITNPKTALFFLTFLPQFVDPSQGAVGLQMLGLGTVYMLLTLTIYGAVAWFSGTIGDWLLRERQAARRFRWLTGGVFVGLGVWAMLPDRRS